MHKLLEDIEINDEIEYRKHISATSLPEMTEESLTEEGEEPQNNDNMSVDEDEFEDEEDEKIGHKLRRSI